MRKPVANGYITSPYGARVLNGVKQFHPGIDIGCKQKDTLIQAAYSGVIYQAGYSKTFGNRVWVRNDNGLYAVYAHMKSINSRLKQGDKIEEGEIIGIMGNTGLSFGVHLHFELREKPFAGAKSIEPIEISKLYEL